MEKYRKRRLTLTIIFAVVSLVILVSLTVLPLVCTGLEAKGYVGSLRPEYGEEFGVGLIVATVLLLALWDVYISLRYFLGEPGMKTGFFTFVNIFALFTASVTVFEIVNVVWDPFGWMDWYKMPYPRKLFTGACALIRLADVVLRFIYLLSYRRFKRTVNNVYDEGARRMTGSFERPPLT